MTPNIFLCKILLELQLSGVGSYFRFNNWSTIFNDCQLLPFIAWLLWNLKPRTSYKAILKVISQPLQASLSWALSGEWHHSSFLSVIHETWVSSSATHSSCVVSQRLALLKCQCRLLRKYPQPWSWLISNSSFLSVLNWVATTLKTVETVKSFLLSSEIFIFYGGSWQLPTTC